MEKKTAYDILISIRLHKEKGKFMCNDTIDNVPAAWRKLRTSAYECKTERRRTQTKAIPDVPLVGGLVVEA